MQFILLNFDPNLKIPVMRSENRTQIEGKLLHIYYHIFVKNFTVMIGKKYVPGVS